MLPRPLQRPQATQNCNNTTSENDVDIFSYERLINFYRFAVNFYRFAKTFLSICQTMTCPSSALKPTKTATPTFIKKISIFFHNFILFILRPKSHEIGHAHNIEKFLNYFSFYSLSISEENYEISRSRTS